MQRGCSGWALGVCNMRGGQDRRCILDDARHDPRTHDRCRYSVQIDNRWRKQTDRTRGGLEGSRWVRRSMSRRGIRDGFSVRHDVLMSRACQLYLANHRGPGGSGPDANDKQIIIAMLTLRRPLRLRVMTGDGCEPARSAREAQCMFCMTGSNAPFRRWSGELCRTKYPESSHARTSRKQGREKPGRTAWPRRVSRFGPDEHISSGRHHGAD